MREGEGEFKELSMRAPGTKQELLSVLPPHLPGGSVRARPAQNAAAPRAPPFPPAPPKPTLSQDTSPPPRALVPTAGKWRGRGLHQMLLKRFLSSYQFGGQFPFKSLISLPILLSFPSHHTPFTACFLGFFPPSVRAATSCSAQVMKGGIKFCKA